MNSNMKITIKASGLSTSLAEKIKSLQSLSSVSTLELEALIKGHLESYDEATCDICHAPYNKAVYFSNGDNYEEFRGGIICKKCIERANQILGVIL